MIKTHAKVKFISYFRKGHGFSVTNCNVTFQRLCTIYALYVTFKILFLLFIDVIAIQNKVNL